MNVLCQFLPNQIRGPEEVQVLCHAGFERARNTDHASTMTAEYPSKIEECHLLGHLAETHSINLLSLFRGPFFEHLLNVGILEICRAAIWSHW